MSDIPPAVFLPTRDDWGAHDAHNGLDWESPGVLYRPAHPDVRSSRSIAELIEVEYLALPDQIRKRRERDCK